MHLKNVIADIIRFLVNNYSKQYKNRTAHHPPDQPSVIVFIVHFSNFLTPKQLKTKRLFGQISKKFDVKNAVLKNGS